MKTKKINRVVTSIAKYFFQFSFTDTFLYQNTLLQNFIKKNIKTEFGEKYRFENIHNIDDFRANVPLHSYDDLQPYIEKMLSGSKNILWCGEVPFFAKSSGTTAVSKYIPITLSALKKNHFSVPRMGMGMYLASYQDAQIFGGKGIILGGRMISNPFDSKKTNIGDVSAILQKYAPKITRMFRKPSLSTSFMADFDKKLDAIIDETIGLSITYVAGVPSWLTLLFQRIAQRFPHKTIAEIWPDLELFLWGGISIAPYKKQLDVLLQGTNIRYRQTYNASEGFFAIQDIADRNDMILAVNHNIFFEFIPFADIDKQYPKTLLAHELIVGEKYELVITTDGGLWRYRIGDVIEVTTINPLRIIVAGRTKSFLNAFGEELMVHTTDGAVEYICQLYNLPRAEYVVTPVVTENGGWHHWYIDFGTTTTIDVELLSHTLDEYIKNHNSDYAAKRNGDLLMKPLEITILQPNTIHTYLVSKGKLGGQHKIKRLWNNAEDLYKEMGQFLVS